MPDWKETYKDFPLIPKSKQWLEDSPNTPEQLITQKLIFGQPIDKHEEEQLKEAIAFYQALIPQLKCFDLTTLTGQNIQEFKDYFLYAFNYIVAVRNDLWVNRVVRLVNNETVQQGARKRIREQKYLSCPSKELVKELNYYNRANTPDFNVFYASDCIDTVLNELQPEPGYLVSAGIWEMTNKSKPLIIYPINHNPMAIEVNPDTRKGFIAFQKIKKKNHPLLMEFMEIFFDFISDEFAKSVDHHMSYFFSAIFSERILLDDTASDWKYDCMVYPSVGNKYSVDNLAILPEVIKKEFKLKKVIEFEVTETHYDRQPKRQSQEEITLVDYKNLETTDWIEENGDIVW